MLATLSSGSFRSLELSLRPYILMKADKCLKNFCVLGISVWKIDNLL